MDLSRAKQEYHGIYFPPILRLNLNKQTYKMKLYSMSPEFNSRTKLPVVAAQELS